ncbi:MAG: hypothetical protein KAR42_15085 [candidate division Zixibacteria bacterium]|nr:hypothetical protein [candidate division Zixibacteria bacterium]
MSDTGGSIRKVTLDGTAFDVFADSNFSETITRFENDRIPTSGRNIKKMTRRVPKVESVVLAANGEEKQVLILLGETTVDFPMSYETAGGDVYRTTGSIEVENRETEELRATVQLHPSTHWNPFLAA